MVLWVCGGCEFCVMVVAPWVSDLLLVVVGCWHGVWVVGMGCRVWVWPCELPACVVGESMGKKKGVAVWVAGMCGWGEVWEKKNNGCGRVGCQHMRLGSVGKKKLWIS